MNKPGAFLLLLCFAWVFQQRTIAAPVSTATSTSTATAAKPAPIAGEPGVPDPRFPGICITKFEQKYPCAEPPPPPPSVAGKVPTPKGSAQADGWDGTKYNNGLYSDLTAGDEHGLLNQGSAFEQYDKVLLLCIGHNVEGRPDDLCTETPTHPECTGLKTSMGHATHCEIPPPPGSPPGAACKSYGAAGYVIDEWLVFGEQYYNGMGGCLSAKEGEDRAIERRQRLQNLTDITDMSLVLGGKTEQLTGSSTITGDAGKKNASTITQALAERFDDGATTLGYERGEFFARAFKGESFSSVFYNSPFAENLTTSIKDSIASAFANPEEVRTKAREKRLAAIEKIKERKEAAGESTIAIETGLANLNSAQPKSVDMVAALEKKARVPASTTLARELESKTHVAAQASAGTKRNWLALSVNADGQVKGSGIDEHVAATPPKEQGGVDGNPEISLFKRVSMSYRRISRELGAYGESKTARDVRLTDTPEFFRDL